MPSGHDVRSLGVPYALHVCGNTKAILADFCTTEADALELDLQDPTSAWPTT